jgi:hypothetical protein
LARHPQAMTANNGSVDRVRAYVRQLTPQVRSRLLVELERLHLSGSDIAGSEVLLAELRAEFRKGGKAHDRVKSPSRHFFHPLEPMLVNCAPERAHAGQISRGSLAAIWEWIGEVLLPAMTREYEENMRHVIVASNPREADKIADAFQSKVVKCLEGMLADPGSVERIRSELAAFTSARESFDDLTKMLAVLQARSALAQFNATLPPGEVDAFEDELLGKVRGPLDTLAGKHADAIPFALTMIAKRLKAPWQLIRLATKAADSRSTARIAATRYAISISMAMDHLDDRRLALCDALKHDRILIAKEILVDIYDIEDALRAGIDLNDRSDWAQRLDKLMQAVAADLSDEVHKLPDNLHHVLASRALHRSDGGAGPLSRIARKGRAALTSSVSYCRNLLSSGQREVT